MPITFTVNHDDAYVICKYSGKITDDELYNSWEKFYEGSLWKPGMMELADNRNADFSEISSDGVRNLAKLCKSIFQKHNITSIKTAMCCGDQLSYGMSRMYEAFTFDSPEKSLVFRCMEEAEAYLKDQMME